MELDIAGQYQCGSEEARYMGDIDVGEIITFFLGYNRGAGRAGVEDKPCILVK